MRQADIGRAAFITEPEAAAVHYASRERLEAGEIVAVYDFGGGTFDAAVLRKTDEGFTLLGHPEGMERLGGIDFDVAVFGHVREALGGAVDEIDRADPTGRAALARACATTAGRPRKRCLPIPMQRSRCSSRTRRPRCGSPARSSRR